MNKKCTKEVRNPRSLIRGTARKSGSVVLLLLLSILFLLGGGGCAGVPVRETPIIKEQIYALPFRSVWFNILNMLKRDGVILSTVDEASGVLTYTKPLQEEQVRASVLEEAHTSGGSSHTTVFVTLAGPERTRVVMNTLIRSSGGQFLSSNGAVEDAFFKELSQNLSAGR